MRRLVVRHLTVCLGTAVALMIGLVAVGWTPRIDFFVGAAVATAVASLALRMLGDSVLAASWSSARATAAGEVGGDARVTFLEHSLRRSGEDESAFALRVRPVLTTVAALRLRRVGVELDDEDHSRPLLGDETWQLLHGPAVHLVGRRQLERAIERIEAL